MNTSMAYILTIIIWSTTPLAIQWSSEAGFLFGVTSRMAIGLIFLALLNCFLGQRLTLHRSAIYTYLCSGMSIYAAMFLVYWGAQYIPSGWVSVIFGLSPLLTSIYAHVLLKNNRLSLSGIAAQMLGLFGLSLIFMTSIELGQYALWGVLAVLLSVGIHSVSAVLIKRIDANIPAMSSVIGGLILAVPLYLITWLLIDGHWPKQISNKNLMAIFYLGIIATAGGFALYYFILQKLSAVKVAMITLVTPVLALLLGYFLNHEELTRQTLLGAICILLAIVLHEFILKFKSE